MADAGSSQLCEPREPNYGPLRAVIDQISQLHVGAGSPTSCASFETLV